MFHELQEFHNYFGLMLIEYFIFVQLPVLSLDFGLVHYAALAFHLVLMCVTFIDVTFMKYSLNHLQEQKEKISQS